PPHLFALFEKMMTPQGVIDTMDTLQIDMSVVSSATVIEPTYWAEPAIALRLSQQLNDTAAEWMAKLPKRLIGSFVLPLQDMDLAMKELKRSVDDLGLKVANLPAEVRGWCEGSMVLSMGDVELARAIARRSELHGGGHI